jgi:hypothetical protein
MRIALACIVFALLGLYWAQPAQAPPPSIVFEWGFVQVSGHVKSAVCTQTASDHFPPCWYTVPKTAAETQPTLDVDLHPPAQTDPTTGQKIEGWGYAHSGKIGGSVMVRRPLQGTSSTSPGDVYAIATVMRVTHFVTDPKAPLGTYYPATVDFSGSIDPFTVWNLNYLSGYVRATLNVEVFVNPSGVPWTSFSTAPPCGSSGVLPVSCKDTQNSHMILRQGNTAQVDTKPAFPLASTWAGPYFDLDILVPSGYEFTIVNTLKIEANLADDLAGETADLSFINSAKLYVDTSNPLYPAVAADGHDYSDPARKRSEIVVLSSGPPSGISGRRVNADPGAIVVGGGAQLTSGTDHVFLSSFPFPSGAYPASGSPSWLAGDVSLSASPAPKPSVTTAYALELKDPSARYRVTVVESSPPGLTLLSGFGSRPAAVAIVPSGYALAGGGCKITPPGVPEVAPPGGRPVVPPPPAKLVGSYPQEASGAQMWVCETQAGALFDAGVITAYAIGIKDTLSYSAPPMRIVTGSSAAAARPTASVGGVGEGFVISACGARMVPNERPIPAGKLMPPDYLALTEMSPTTPSNALNRAATGCKASASDYGTSAAGKVTAYSVNLLLDRAKLSSISTSTSHAGTVLELTGTGFVPGMKVRFTPPGGSYVETPATVALNSVHKANVVVPNTPGMYVVDVSLGDVVGSSAIPPTNGTDTPLVLTVVP